MMRASLLTSSCSSVLCALALMGCEEVTPTPVDIQNNDTMGPPDIDFIEIIGKNAEDPNTSAQCPLGITCAPLPGEPTNMLTAGTCDESHFKVMSDGTRAFVDEVERTHLSNGRLAALTSDRGNYTLSYSGTRIQNLTFEPALAGGVARSVDFEYVLTRLSDIKTTQGSDVIKEQSFTYDEQRRTATSFTKLRQPDGTFLRQSHIYNYTGEQAREIWQDLDVNKALSEPDELQSSSAWLANGLLDTRTTFDGADASGSSLSYVYNADGLLTGTTLATMETTLATHTFTYDEESRLMGIGFGQQAPRLALTRDEAQQLSLAQIIDAEDRVLHEIEMSGSSCDRPINTWIGQVMETMDEGVE
jgi:YD repeat-containing protein